MTKPKKLSTRLTILFVVVGVALIAILIVFVYQLDRLSYPTNAEQCDEDSRYVTAEERNSPLYEPPASCLYATQEPDAPYTFAR